MLKNKKTEEKLSQIETTEELLDTIQSNVDTLQEIISTPGSVEYYLQNLDEIRMKCSSVYKDIREIQENWEFTDEGIENIVQELSS